MSVGGSSLKNNIHKAFPSCCLESWGSIEKIIHITTSGTTFSVILESERLEIPVRIYGEELDNSVFEAMSFEERILLACLFSRHHNGYIRQKYAEILIQVSMEMPWVFPYVVGLVGEYVIDIKDLIYREKERIPNKVVRQFSKQNKFFMQTTKQRMISYWNEYYRNDYPNKKDYVGMKLFSYWEQINNNR